MANTIDSETRAHISGELWQVLARHQLRIAAAVALLLLAKLATVAVPLLLKRIIDAFPAGGLPAHLPSALPVHLLAGYALLRFSATLFNELHDLLFVRVTLAAVSAYAQKTFARLHSVLDSDSEHAITQEPDRRRAIERLSSSRTASAPSSTRM